MKKFFTLLTALTAATMAWAEAPELYFHGNPVQEGVTYETGYETNEVIPGVMVIYKQDSGLEIKGTAGAKVKVEVSASEVIQICALGDCIQAQSITKEGQLDGKLQSLLIDKEYVDMDNVANPSSLMNDITVEVTAYYVDSPNEKATAKVLMTNKSESEVGGIASAVAGNSISLRGNTLNYNVAQPTKLDIYSVSGALVMSQKVYSNGSISLDSLHPGVYIYSANGLIGKLLIRK